MSELENRNLDRVISRWQLLATASAIALIGSTYGVAAALASDSDNDRPQVWIELGGQLSRLEAGQEVFSPSLMDARPSAFSSSDRFEKPSLYSIDETDKVSLQTGETGWTFAASVRYGRSSSNRRVRQQTHPAPAYKYYGTPPVRTPSNVPQLPFAAKFAETKSSNTESHLVLDFQAGKDVGMGMFGSKDSYSALSAGVRFAQFNTKSNISLESDPDHRFEFTTFIIFKRPKEVYHSNQASLIASRSFEAVGPSVSWSASVPFVGSSDHGELLADWGFNAAVLFGRQKARTAHQTTGLYHSKNAAVPDRSITTQTATAHARSRSVIVPNAGGFAGMTFRINNFKASAGYRADFFFGAMDGGIDSRKTYDRNFHGPFASISIGL